MAPKAKCQSAVALNTEQQFVGEAHIYLFHIAAFDTETFLASRLVLPSVR